LKGRRLGRHRLFIDDVINTSIVQAATAPDKTADVASVSCFSKRLGGDYKSSFRRLLRAAAMGHRAPGGVIGK
jgi:hypothetical protein